MKNLLDHTKLNNSLTFHVGKQLLLVPQPQTSISL